MAHLTEAHGYLKMCIQREKEKFQRLEEAQDTPTAELCEGILQTFGGYFGQISSFWSVGLHAEGGMVKEHRQERLQRHPPPGTTTGHSNFLNLGNTGHRGQNLRCPPPPPQPNLCYPTAFLRH